MEKQQHGGFRKGAGRKKSLVPSKTISFRVPCDFSNSDVEQIKCFIKTLKNATIL